MSADDLSLPDDMGLLKPMVCAMAQKTAALEDETAALKARSADAPFKVGLADQAADADPEGLRPGPVRAALGEAWRQRAECGG
jgi:hypothetical protein